MNTYANPYLYKMPDREVLVEVLTAWGQHPDTMDPDLMGSRTYLQTADIQELADVILKAGFWLDKEA